MTDAQFWALVFLVLVVTKTGRAILMWLSVVAAAFFCAFVFVLAITGASQYQP